MALWIGGIALAVLLAVDYWDSQRQRWRRHWTERMTVMPSGRKLTVHEPCELSTAVLSGIPDEELSDAELERKMEPYRVQAAELAIWAETARQIRDLPEIRR